MRLTLTQQNKVHFLSLPSELTGQYIMTYSRSSGAEDALLSIRPEKGRWLAECGMNAYITISGKNYRSCTIDRCGISLDVYIRTNGEVARLSADDDSADMTRFRKYVLNGNAVIGKNSGCDFILKTANADEQCAEIICDEKTMRIRPCGRTPVFVNGLRTGERQLFAGDVVFVSGYSFICGQKLVAVDRVPLLSVRSGGSVCEYIPPQEDVGKLDYYFDDVKKEKYIYTSPRFVKRLTTKEIKIVPPPAARDGDKQPAVLSLGPAFTMGMASAATGTFSVLNNLSRGGDIMSVAPVLVMSGSMFASSLLWPIINKSYTRHKTRHDERKRKGVYLKYLQGVQQEISDGMEEQLQTLGENNPDIPTLEDRIKLSASTLWERSADDGDFLRVCVGTGRIPFDCTIKADIPELEVKPDILYDEMRKVVNGERILENAPVALDLRTDYICGIAGEKQLTAGLARALILQLAALRSYKELKLVMIYGREDEQLWGSVRWLPHTWDDRREMRYIASDAEELNALASALEAELSDSEGGASSGKNQAERSGRHYVLLCASKPLASKTSLITHIVQKGRYANFSVLAIYPEERLLPRECTAVMRLCGEKETQDRTGGTERRLMLQSRRCAVPQMVKPVDIGLQSFTDDSVMLADKRLGAEESGYDMPDMLTFLEMYGVKSIEELNCLQRWQRNSSVRSLAAPIGVDSRGDLFSLDLHQKAHGPHGLIAGTTGSGKSEFIMTMILSLAVNYSPHDISFLLIDYKGGGMAVAFDSLPHVAGIITNLDGAAVNRSLISIQSELKRRQALFLSEGKRLGMTISDIYKYQKLYKEGRLERPLQHLYIISDEFAELKSQQPDFMSELISAARIGRSLGVHLILATQKPSGVVNDQIWSNSRFKICLKVQERADSVDVIRCPDAAAITQTGRFYLQVGYNEIFEMGQSAWAGAKYDPSAAAEKKVDDSIEIVDNVGRVIMQAENEKRENAEKKGAENSPQEHDTQLQEITKYIGELCRRENMSADKLWLDPIPERIFVRQLEEKYGFEKSADRLSALVGEYDVPQRQKQFPLVLSPQDGNIIVYGSAGSGKTTFLTTYIFSMLQKYSAEKNVFYIVDCASEMLRAFEGYNAVGVVCTLSDMDRVRNLFSYITTEMTRRRDILSTGGRDFSVSADDMPAIQLVIANIGAFCESMEYDDQLERILKDGPKLGIYVVASQMNSVVKHRLAQNFSSVFCLQLNNGAYSDVLSAVGRMMPAKYKGRGLFRHEFVSEFQTAYITEDKDVFAYVRAQAQAVNKLHGGAKAKQIRVLPKVLNCDEALKLTEDKMRPVIALGRTNVEPVTIDLSARMNVFASRSLDAGAVAQGVCGVASRLCHSFVFDVMGVLDVEADNAEYYSGDKIPDGIRRLFSLARERNNRAVEMDKSGGRADFSGDMIACVIYGLDSLLSKYQTLSEQERVSEESRIYGSGKEVPEDIVQITVMRETMRMLTLLLLGGEHDFGISFVIFDSASNLLAHRQEQWFTRHFRLKNYFWVGAGLGVESSFHHQAINEARMEFGEDLGWSAEGGRAKMVRFVSTLTEE